MSSRPLRSADQVRFAKIAAHLGDEFHHAILAMDGDYACRSRLDPRVHVSYPEITFRKGHTAQMLSGFAGACESCDRT